MMVQAVFRERHHQNAVCRGYAHTHNRAHQSGHTQRSSRRKQEDRNARKGKLPSDHAPVIVDVDIDIER